VNETPVFQSNTGRRWKLIKISAFIITAVVVGFSFYIVPRIFTVQPVSAFHATQPFSQINANHPPTESSAGSVATQMAGRNTPVIGKGPLIRILRVTDTGKEKITSDPFTGARVGTINAGDSSKVRGYTYVIERYGYTTGKHIALTFDDGPDPVYSAPILDVLSQYGAPSTFFVVGTNVVKYPDIAKRMVNEGHALSNHTYDHKDPETLNDFARATEINMSQRTIRAATQTNPAFFRVPYGGNTDQTLRESAKGILTSQQLGYIMASYDYDTNDWQFNSGFKPELPDFDGQDMVVLLHDAGGDRQHTVEYLKKFIPAAKAKGYTFTTLNHLYAQTPSLVPTVTANLADHTTLAASQALFVWPKNLIGYLFILTAWSMFVALVVNVTLATIQVKRTQYKRRANHYNPKVTIIVPAYNEARVLAGGVRSLLKSHYKNYEILIVDDGSTDDTWAVAKQLAKRYKRVRAIHQKNGSKASAINNGVKKSKGEIIIGVDADTVFLPQTVTRLIRHFVDPTVGAVAGSVKVGNAGSFLTTWQALEYIVSINLERNAQALLGAIVIVPGACGAWRKEALLRAGGYSRATLAEDCDLTLSVHRVGYKVLQDNSAVAYTEAPEAIEPFIKQRFRWMFGSIQALWKHRDMMLKYR